MRWIARVRSDGLWIGNAVDHRCYCSSAGELWHNNVEPGSH
ncbi:MAG: hypothetical protein ACYTG0_30745 [Planctomycetota bacterium]